MAEYIIQDSTLTEIANAIRDKSGKNGVILVSDMSTEIASITSGGDELNFDVKAYVTKEALLAATPAENTIGVITTTPITSWIFSETEPSNIEADMVWFIIDHTSNIEFNALNKNGIQIKPRRTKQIIDGVWTDVPTWIYQNSEWKEWINRLYLFKDGDTCDHVTGGWTTGISGKTLSVSSLAIARTKNKIDFTDYKTLYINLAENNCPASSWQLISVTENSSTTGDAGRETDYSARWLNSPTGWQTVGGMKTIDVSKLTGSYYVKLSAYASTITATSIYME